MLKDTFHATLLIVPKNLAIGPTMEHVLVMASPKIVVLKNSQGPALMGQNSVATILKSLAKFLARMQILRYLCVVSNFMFPKYLIY